MIIFINGSFGVGKTTVTTQLAEHLPNAMLYDPELVGAILREMTHGIRSGKEDSDDFQDIGLWRSLTGVIAGHLQTAYGRTLVIPMTVSLVPRLTATGPSPDSPKPARPQGLSPLPDTTMQLQVPK